MGKSIKYNGVSFKFEHKDKTSNMGSFVILEIMPKIFEVINKSYITVNNLKYFFSNRNGKGLVFMGKFIKLFSQRRSNDEIKTHFNPIILSNSSKLIGFFLPDFSSLDACSIDLTTSLTTDSLIFLLSSLDIPDISLTIENSKFRTNCLTTLFNANSNSSLNSFGIFTLIDISSIYEYYSQEYLNLWIILLIKPYFLRIIQIENSEKRLLQLLEFFISGCFGIKPEKLNNNLHGIFRGVKNY